MAERLPRERLRRQPAAPRVDEVVEATTAAPTSVDYDAILDQIDAVLESDAEEYVRSFVQKGGQ
ncbi:MAG: ubiquitin-like protein Pup [Propionicimonas sp.]|uniref:ubiquitin-like protein Pup n=1 Tax=Propionicimonas sp. TaxID=1955623 RepID=UPI003D12F655